MTLLILRYTFHSFISEIKNVSRHWWVLHDWSTFLSHEVMTPYNQWCPRVCSVVAFIFFYSRCISQGPLLASLCRKEGAQAWKVDLCMGNGLAWLARRIAFVVVKQEECILYRKDRFASYGDIF